ncbi:unnamed protein product [Ambrosiozyma monospora]|uniref:Unnamed protein product n=1 Tax=Ambrosiozyma monospora TaxID=43982 RepID=A0A9W6Z0Q0_AMBMO|nr:unnamed protein product [Ambrosiozyma monospora]
MITPYDTKIDAVDSKITTQLTAVQADQTGNTTTLNNMKNEQNAQRSMLENILAKLDTISPTPSETHPYPRPLKTAPTSSTDYLARVHTVNDLIENISPSQDLLNPDPDSAIITTTNRVVNEINDKIFEKLDLPPMVYRAHDSIFEDHVQFHHYSQETLNSWLKIQLTRIDLNGLNTNIDNLLDADVIDREPINLATLFHELIKAKVDDQLLRYYKKDFGINLYLNLKRKFGKMNHFNQILLVADFVQAVSSGNLSDAEYTEKAVLMDYYFPEAKKLINMTYFIHYDKESINKGLANMNLKDGGAIRNNFFKMYCDAFKKC